MAPPASIEALLANAAWLRNLARQMLADRGLADDAVQETWLATLRARPEEGKERGWLVRVLGHAAGQRERSERARGARERASARPEALPPTDEVVARAELFAKLVAAVLALDEPYRTTILWRYFEELPAEEIARRAGIDVATVRSRTKRGREKLRERLIVREGKDPERWLAALAGTARIGGTLMGIKQGALLALAVVVAVALAWRVSTARTGAVLPREGSEQLASLDAPEHDELGPDRALPVAAAREVAETAPAAPAALALLRGRVLSEDGRVPLEGARVDLRRGLETESIEERTREGTRTGPDGRFELPRPELPDEGLWIEAPGHFPYKLSPGDLPADVELEIVLAPLGRLVFELVDDLGVPVPEIAIGTSIDVNRGSKDHEWANRRTVAAGRTDRAGRLEVAGLPCAMPITFRRADVPEFFGSAVIDPHERTGHLRAVLPRTARIIGRLVDEHGVPADATILRQTYPIDHGASASTRPGADGGFAFEDVQAAPGEVRIDLPGFVPLAVEPRCGETLDLGTLTLPALARLEGRLVSRFLTPESRAEALGGLELRVFHAGAELCELAEGVERSDDHFELALVPSTLELLVSRGGFWFAGITRPREVLVRLRLDAPTSGLVIDLDESSGALDLALGPDRAGQEADVTLFALDPPDELGQRTVRADASGNARLALVAPGRLRAVLALDGGASRSSEPFEIIAGTLTRVELGPRQTLALSGHVRTVAGAPVAGAAVSTRHRGDPHRTTTDASGNFRLEALAPDHYTLGVRHDDFGATELENVPLFAGDAPPLEITLAGFATVEGRVTVNGEPVRALAIDAQPQNSNDGFHALTGDDGRFLLERLEPCRLRVWAQGRFVQVLDLAGGERRELALELGPRRTLRFVRDGRVLALQYARAIGLDSGDLERRLWRTGQKDGDGFAFDLPPGRVLFDLSLPRSGANESLLVLATPAGDSVEVPSRRVELDTGEPWEGPRPRVELTALDGGEVLDIWARSPELLVEVAPGGSLGIPCVPEGAELRITGFDRQGRPHVESIEVHGNARIAWP